MPKPAVEKWKNLRMSIIDCKATDTLNLCEYLKQSKEIREMTFRAGILSPELNAALNVSKLLQLNLEVCDLNELPKVTFLVKCLDK
jgi:hypothetical protein